MIDAQTVSAIASDAGAFPYQLDLVQRRALFVRLGEGDFRSASFLDERLTTKGREGFWLPVETLNQIAAETSSNNAPGFIFHIGHCGSTLLSRMLEERENLLALREPMILRSLAAAGGELASPLSRLSPDGWNELLSSATTLLGRSFTPDQRVLIKATSICNNLIEPLLRMPVNARCVLLYIPLENYLATMLKGAGGGVDGLHGAQARLQFLHTVLDDDSLRLHQMGHGEILAMGWAAELARFDAIEASFSTSDRVMFSNFEDILESPEQHAVGIARHLGLTPASGNATPLSESKVMASYSKSPDHAYSPADRAHDLNLSRRKFADQIAQGMHWAEQVIQRHPKLGSLASRLR